MVKCSPTLGSSFFLSRVSGKGFGPALYIRQGHMPRLSLKNVSRSETVTSGPGNVRVGMLYPCSLFPEKDMKQ